MDKETEFEIALKGMKYDQMIMLAIRNGEHKRAIAISKRRHKAIKKLIERDESEKAKSESQA